MFLFVNLSDIEEIRDSILVKKYYIRTYLENSSLKSQLSLYLRQI